MKFMAIDLIFLFDIFYPNSIYDFEIFNLVHFFFEIKQ